MIRVLHVIGAMDRAGAETFVMNTFRSIDRNQIAYDFLVHTNDDCDYDNEIRSLGGNIYRLPKFNGLNYPQYKKACRQFFQEHPEIDIVHGHIGSSAPIYLKEAKRAAKRTIAHSHNYSPSRSPSMNMYRALARPVVKHADLFFACSYEAAVDRFGKGVADSEKSLIVNNGIDLTLYQRNSELAKQAKDALGFDKEPIFIHIGRFSEQKNHKYLIEVFKGIKERMPDARLLLVGRGPNEDNVRKLVHDAGLDESVHFLGIRADIPDILRASDVFLFPSLYEGLGIALVEAQAVGLPCLVSDRIPEISIMTDRVQQLPIDDSEMWVEAAVHLYGLYSGNFDNCTEEVKSAGFDIRDVAELMEESYREILEGA